MGFRKSEPKYRLKFEINESHCETAVRKDPCRCVIAQVMYEKFGDSLASIHVLPTTTTLVYHNGRMTVYRTPRILRDGLKSFDETGVWDLAVGTYYLLPRKRSERYGMKKLRSKSKTGKPPVKRGPYARRLDPRMITLRNMKKV
jgi:hypothetical protein